MRNPWLGIYILLAIIGVTFVFFLYSLLPKNSVEFTDLPGQTQTVPNIKKTDPILGDSTTGWFWQPQKEKITIVLYGDFLSDSNVKTLSGLFEIYEDFSENILIVWKDFPNPTINVESLNAAIAGQCANSQNRFWEFAKLLNDNRYSADEKLYKEIATDLNLGMWRFNRCLAKQKTIKTVQASYDEAINLHLTSAPSVFIAGRWYTGELSEADLRTIILDLQNTPN